MCQLWNIRRKTRVKGYSAFEPRLYHLDKTKVISFFISVHGFITAFPRFQKLLDQVIGQKAVYVLDQTVNGIIVELEY